MTQQQMTHQEARRKEAEDAVERLAVFIAANRGDLEEMEDAFKALEYLAWEAGCLEFFKRLRSE